MDASTVDRKDLNLRAFISLGEGVFYPQSTPAQIVDRCRDADVVVSNKCILGEKEFSQLPRLKLVSVMATGYNNVDLASARKRRIALCNVPAYSTATVAEHAFLFMLAFAHRLMEHHRVAISKWPHSPIFAILDYPFSDLEGKNLGIVGYGHIGKKVARIAKSFGMKVGIAALPGRKYAAHPPRLSLKKLLSQSDFVSLHLALAPQTKHLINTHTLKYMKKSACLLNLARGAVVDEKAVAKALLQKQLAGYASDVMEQEPPPHQHPFWNPKLKDKIILTPHVAWASRESRQRLLDESVKNIRSFLEGRKRNRIC